MVEPCLKSSSQEIALLMATPPIDFITKIGYKKVDNPMPQGTLGDVGLALEITGPSEFEGVIVLKIPFNSIDIKGIDTFSLRVFRWNDKSNAMQPVWNSGVNTTQSFIWAKINKPGLYVPIGLPSDKYLRNILWIIARTRRYSDSDSIQSNEAITKRYLEPIIGNTEEEFINNLLHIETNIGPEIMPEDQIKRSRRGMLMPFPRKIQLPHTRDDVQFRQRLVMLKTPPGGLPEEQLFYTPEQISQNEWKSTEMLISKSKRYPDWWMYHHDEIHSGQASGSSNITSTSVSKMRLRQSIPLDGPVISIPCIVRGKIYVGTGNSKIAASNYSSEGGTLHRIDLQSGKIENQFTFYTDPGHGSAQGFSGIGCSPAIVAGKVYFSGLDGKVYCLDANTLSPVWITDLRNVDPAHNQPVQSVDKDKNDIGEGNSAEGASAEGWTSPLVVNGKVYVGFGEGESGAYGFVYCLDADSGHVIWLFCTNQFVEGVDNKPNVIPESTSTSFLPNGFSTLPDPKHAGMPVWSSCVFGRIVIENGNDKKIENRIFFGTGNSTGSKDPTLPDYKYGCGVVALEAETGKYRGFFGQTIEHNYRKDDDDVDIGASPMLFNIGDKQILAIGSKNGSFFLLNPKDMSLIKWQQLLPRDIQSKSVGEIDHHFDHAMMTPMTENMYGIFGTAAVDYERNRLFVGIGGYDGAIDSCSTPFMRALDWVSLDDVWSTNIDEIRNNQKVKRYMLPKPPMYSALGEVGLSSPAIVNDVVFVSTSLPAVYAFDSQTGLCLWQSPNFTPSSQAIMLGPAIYGDYLVIGDARGIENGNIYIYSLYP